MKYLARGSYMAAALAAVMILVRCDYFDPYRAAWLPAPPDTTVCGLTRSELILPERWAMLQEYLRDQVSAGVSGTPTADTGTITGLGVGGLKWYGGVLAPNGKIYGIPENSDSVLIIDPETNTKDTTTITTLPGGTQWIGGVLATNGNIYGMPFNETSVLIIGTKSNGAFCDNVAMCGYFNKL